MAFNYFKFTVLIFIHILHTITEVLLILFTIFFILGLSYLFNVAVVLHTISLHVINLIRFTFPCINAVEGQWLSFIVIHVSYMSPTCLLHFSYMSPTCILYVSFMSPTWFLHISYMSPTCILYVSYMSPTWFLHISYISPTCLLHVSYMSPTYLLHFSYIFLMCFLLCFLYVSYMPPTRFLYVSYRKWDKKCVKFYICSTYKTYTTVLYEI